MDYHGTTEEPNTFKESPKRNLGGKLLIMARKKAQLFVWNGFSFTQPQPGGNSKFLTKAALLATEVVKDFPKGLPCWISFEAPFKKKKRS